MKQIQSINGKVIVDVIYTEPKSKAAGIISPQTGRPMGTTATFEDHPYRGLVMSAPKFFYNGGFRYEVEIKEGDIIFLPETVEKGTDYVYIDGIEYSVINYQTIIGHVTPTDAERGALKFVRETDSQRTTRSKEKSSLPN